MTLSDGSVRPVCAPDGCGEQQGSRGDPSAQSQAAQQPGAPRLPILIVDDDDAIRESMGEIFKNKGYEEASASNGAQALRMLATEPFGAMVLDLVMPGTGGASVLRELRLQRSTVPTILLSGYIGMLDDRRFTAMGARASFRKPCDLLELVAAVERIMQEEEANRPDEAAVPAKAGSREAQPGITTEMHGDTAIVHFGGDPTSGREDLLWTTIAKLIKGPRKTVLVDLTRAQSVSNSELSILLFYQRQLEKRGIELLMVNPGQHGKKTPETGGSGQDRPARAIAAAVRA